MKRSIKLAIEQSEKRESLNTLVNLTELSTEQRAERDRLTTRLQAIEPELRAVLVAEAADDEALIAEAAEGEPEREGDDDAEAVEMRALARRANMGAIMSNTLEHRATTGAEAEIQKHFRLQGNQIPLAMLRSEHRAVTPAPTNVGQNMAAIIPGVFPMSAAAFLGVDMPTVAVGEAVYPVLTKNAEVKTPAENIAAADTTGSFSAEVLSPARLQAAFFYSREDRARFAGMDAALRMNLSDALSDGLDRQIIRGTNGLLTGTNLDNNNVSAVTTYARYRSQLAYGRVDGTFANSVGDVRVLMGSETYAHASGQFRSDNAGDRAALEDLMGVTGGVQVSAHVPAVASNKQNTVIRLGMRRDMVAPVWEGVTLIFDEVTLADEGQIKLTSVMLYAVQILRAGGFFKQQTQHA